MCLIEVFKFTTILYVLIKSSNTIIGVLWGRILIYDIFDVLYDTLNRLRFLVFINTPTISFSECVKESTNLFCFSRIYDISVSLLIIIIIVIILFVVNYSCVGRIII
nr:MAG TPA: hypothetical protein [Caudoviricetes sp.]